MKKTIILILFFTVVLILSYFISEAFPSIVKY